MVFDQFFRQRLWSGWGTFSSPRWWWGLGTHGTIQVRLGDWDGAEVPPDPEGNHPSLWSLELSPVLAQRLIAHYRRDPASTQTLVDRLELIDFGPLVQRLWQSQLLHRRWSRERMQRAIQTYACFLLDAALQPTAPLPAVDGDMDVVWHCHILQTQKYTQDCMTLFGVYLHHAAIATPRFSSSNGSCNIGISLDGTDSGSCHIGRSSALQPTLGRQPALGTV